MTIHRKSFPTINPLALDHKSVMFDHKSVIYKPANACGTSFRGGYKGLQRYEVPITKATTRICPVENSIFKPAVLSLFPLEPWDGLPSLRFARRSPLKPPVRRHVARGCRNFGFLHPLRGRLFASLCRVKGVFIKPFSLHSKASTHIQHLSDALRSSQRRSEGFYKASPLTRPLDAVKRK